jgi:hypothetical protein
MDRSVIQTTLITVALGIAGCTSGQPMTPDAGRAPPVGGLPIAPPPTPASPAWQPTIPMWLPSDTMELLIADPVAADDGDVAIPDSTLADVIAAGTGATADSQPCGGGCAAGLSCDTVTDVCVADGETNDLTETENHEDEESTASDQNIEATEVPAAVAEEMCKWKNTDGECVDYTPQYSSPLFVDTDTDTIHKGYGSTLIAGRTAKSGDIAILESQPQSDGFKQIASVTPEEGEQPCASDPALIYHPFLDRIFLLCVGTNQRLQVRIGRSLLKTFPGGNKVYRDGIFWGKATEINAVALDAKTAPQPIFERRTRRMYVAARKTNGRLTLLHHTIANGWGTEAKPHVRILGYATIKKDSRPSVILDSKTHDIVIAAQSHTLTPTDTYGHSQVRKIIIWKIRIDPIIGTTASGRKTKKGWKVRYGTTEKKTTHDGLLWSNGYQQAFGATRIAPTLIRDADGIAVVSVAHHKVKHSNICYMSRLTKWRLLSGMTPAASTIHETKTCKERAIYSRLGSAYNHFAPEPLLLFGWKSDGQGKVFRAATLKKTPGLPLKPFHFGIEAALTDSPFSIIFDPANPVSRVHHVIFRKGSTLHHLQHFSNGWGVITTGPGDSYHGTFNQTPIALGPSTLSWVGTPAIVFNGNPGSWKSP